MAADERERTHVMMRAPGFAKPKLEPEAATLYPGLVVLSGSDLGTVHYFDEDGRTLGRDSEVQIRLRDDLVSRRHAQVYRQEAEGSAESQYVLVDLHSTNGTFVNEERISKAFLHDGDRIRVGRTTLKFTIHDDIEHQYSAEIQRRIEHDDLTGLLTINHFYARLDQALATAQDAKTPVALAMLDLDGLKAVNDEHGHLGGSEVIKTVARLLAEGVQPPAVVGRYGGDEFVLFYPGFDTEAALAPVRELLRAVETQVFQFPGGSARVTLSAGVASYPWDCASAQDLVSAADTALFRAKRTGKNRAETCTPPGSVR